MQRLVKCCLRAAFSSTVLELSAKDTQAPRAACVYDALVRRFTARRYSAAAGDALSTEAAEPLRFRAVELLFFLCLPVPIISLLFSEFRHERRIYFVARLHSLFGPYR
jgi:hypothetical protein